MPALLAWHIWHKTPQTRSARPPSREVRIAADAIAHLSDSDRQCAEGWLAGGFDRDIAQRLAVAVETVAHVRLDLLAGVARRLAQRPTRALDDWR